jgi:hypothetical protein
VEGLEGNVCALTALILDGEKSLRHPKDILSLVLYQLRRNLGRTLIVCRKFVEEKTIPLSARNKSPLTRPF